MENLQVARAAPTPANVTVGRPREYLTEREVEKLMDAARGNRWGHRDATAILIAYRHGLRASELVALRWDDIDFQTGKLHVRRAKGGMASVHPLGAKELTGAAPAPAGDRARGARLRVGALGAAERGRLSAHVAGNEEAELAASPARPHVCPSLVQLVPAMAQHSRDPALSRSPVDCLDGAVHRPGSGSLQCGLPSS